MHSHHAMCFRSPCFNALVTKFLIAGHFGTCDLFESFTYYEQHVTRDHFRRQLMIFANSLGLDQDRQNVGSDLEQKLFDLLWRIYFEKKKLICKR